MKTKTLVVFALAAGGIIASAQTNQPTNDWKPSLSNLPGQGCPQVNSEGRVRARLRAPDAQNVELNISGVKFPMTKDTDGVWTAIPRRRIRAIIITAWWWMGLSFPIPPPRVRS